jgi:spoIIIJ-associated protein
LKTKTEKDAIELAATELGLEKDQFDVEIIESQKNTIFKKGFVRILVHTDDAVSRISACPTERISSPRTRFRGHAPSPEPAAEG